MKFKAKNGGIIVVPQDVVKSIVYRSGVLRLLDEAISKIFLPQGDELTLEAEVDMGRIVGSTIHVETFKIGLDEAAFFATRTDKDKPSRVSLAGKGIPSSTITIIARPIKKGNKVNGETVYALLSAWIGNLAAKEPWSKTIESKEELERCLNYWQKNAFVYDPESMGIVFETTLNEVLGERNRRFRDD